MQSQSFDSQLFGEAKSHPVHRCEYALSAPANADCLSFSLPKERIMANQPFISPALSLRWIQHFKLSEDEYPNWRDITSSSRILGVMTILCSEKSRFKRFRRPIFANALARSVSIITSLAKDGLNSGLNLLL
jgi:hypothetical protein